MVGKPHWLISRILKKWILTTFASVLVAFMESIFGGPYFDILEVLCFYFEPIYIFLNSYILSFQFRFPFSRLTFWIPW